MQVQPFSAAASAAGVTSQATSKDKDSKGSQASGQAASTTPDIHVEQSGESSPDRDAQGQGDGLRNGTSRHEADQSDETEDVASKAALLPGEEPGELDIIG